jgi:hypothetical protein
MASFTRRFLSGGTGVRQTEHPKVASAGPTHPSGRPTQGRDGGSLPDLARQVRANAEQLGVVLARGPQARDVPAQVADDAPSVAVGPHPERVGLLPLQQVGALVEEGRSQQRYVKFREVARKPLLQCGFLYIPLPKLQHVNRRCGEVLVRQDWPPRA